MEVIQSENVAFQTTRLRKKKSEENWLGYDVLLGIIKIRKEVMSIGPVIGKKEDYHSQKTEQHIEVGSKRGSLKEVQL